MIKILSLANGELVIGYVENEILNDSDVVVYGPMYIVQTMADMNVAGFKLEDMLMFSDDDFVTIPHQRIITVMNASSHISAYYDEAIKFNNAVVKPMIERQIDESTLYVKDNLSAFEDGEKSSRFTRSRMN